MSLFELTRPLRQGLAGLRRRARSLVLMLGAGRVAVVACAALLLFFLADYGLRLPLWVRGVGLVALLAVTGTVLFRRLLRPLSHPLPDALLAARVEAAHPELQDRLSSSLAFATAEQDPDNEDSPDLMRVVAEQTVAETSRLRFAAVARPALAVRWGAGGAVLLLLLAGAAFTRPDLAGTFARRALLLQDIAWPRRTTLVVEGMEPGVPRRVTRGRETTLEIRALGSVPDRVVLTIAEAEAGDIRPRRLELTPSAADPTLFACPVRVLTSYRFTVTGGDDDRALPYLIEALTPPAILEVTMRVTYPEYLGRAPETLRGGGQRLPEGTRARVFVKVNMPLSLATIAIGGEDAQALEPVEEALYATTIEARRDVRYSLRLVGRNGEENDPGMDTFFLQVAKDQPPFLAVRTPGARTERLPTGVALLAVTARDDHRVTGVTLVYRINDGEERRVSLGESGGDALRVLEPANRPPEEVQAVFALDLGRLRKADDAPVAKGDQVVYFFETTDSAGQTQRTRTEAVLHLVTEEELATEIDTRQQELNDAVRRAESRSREAVDLVRSLTDARGDAAEFHRWTGRARAAQDRVMDDLDRLARRVQGLLNLYVFNRLADPAAADQILPWFERHLLQPADRTANPFRGELYLQLHQAQQERRIRGGGTYGKLI